MPLFGMSMATPPELPAVENPPARAPSDNAKSATPKGAFAIKIGDRIDDGVPAPGAGSIESPYAQDVYSFPATAGQQVYFRMLRHSNGLSYIRWRLTDPDGMEG